MTVRDLLKSADFGAKHGDKYKVVISSGTCKNLYWDYINGHFGKYEDWEVTSWAEGAEELQLNLRTQWAEG